MEPYADVNCVLKVNVHCEACKMKMVQVLHSIIGVYRVDIDAREGTAKVSGEVDPNILLRALARTGKHAEIAWVKLKHPVLNRSYYNDEYYGSYNNYGHGGGCGNYKNYGGNFDQEHYRPYNSRQQYYPMRRAVPLYADESANYCTIM